MDDSLNVISRRASNEGPIISTMVVLSRPRCSVILTTSLDARIVKGLDLCFLFEVS